MACRKYEEALRDLAAGPSGPAAGGDEAEREVRLRAHLEACADCRATFEYERQLYSAMDSALNEELNAPAPGSLAARIRAAVDADAEPWRLVFWRTPVFAALAVLSIVLAVFMGLRGRHDASPPSQTGVHVPPMARQTGAEQAGQIARLAAPPEKVTPRRPMGTVRVRPHREPGPRRPSTAVLVPAGQEEAVARLLLGLQRGDIKGEMLLAERANFTSMLPEIAPLEVKPTVVKPLEIARPDSE